MAKSLKSLPQAAIHIDLDGASAIYGVHSWSFPYERDPLFESGLLNALDFLDHSGLKATMFVIAQDLQDEHKRELIEEAIKRGHEIASHSLTHRKLTTLDQKSKRLEILESRELLESKLGVKVRGFRAPSFDIDLETLEIVAEAGYEYDSSIFPKSVDSIEVDVTNCEKSLFYQLKNSHLIELPLPGYSPLPWPFHPSYSLILGFWYFRLGLNQFLRTGAPLIFLFHLTDLAEPLAKSWLPGWKAKFFTLSHIKYEQKQILCKQMVELVKRNFQMVETSALLKNCKTEMLTFPK